MTTRFTETVKKLIRDIPKGNVSTYGVIAAAAGNPRGARQVARILHACSAKDQLPWHRVVNRNGRISLRPFDGYEIQKQMLENEGVLFDDNEVIDLKRFLWTGPKPVSHTAP